MNNMKPFIFKAMYQILDKLEWLLKNTAEKLSNITWIFKERYWHSQMPSNVRLGESGLPDYYCPFCDEYLDYRIDFNGVSNGVCWRCKKAWLETWDNSDCPSFDNFNWPTKENVSDSQPLSFWETCVNHAFERRNGVMVDVGVADKVQRDLFRGFGDKSEMDDDNE